MITYFVFAMGGQVEHRKRASPDDCKIEWSGGIGSMYGSIMNILSPLIGRVGSGSVLLRRNTNMYATSKKARINNCSLVDRKCRRNCIQ